MMHICYPFNDGIPDGVIIRERVKVEEYLKQLESYVQSTIDEGVTAGRAKKSPNLTDEVDGQADECYRVYSNQMESVTRG